MIKKLTPELEDKIIKAIVKDDVKELDSIINRNKIFIDARDSGTRTLLMIAIDYASENCTRYLLDNGAKLNNITDKFGWYPIHFAVKFGHVKMFQLLVEEYGAELEVGDEDGDTPFIFACEEGQFEIIKLMVEKYGVDINKTNKKGYTGLYKASKFGRTKVVEYLKKHGAKDTPDRWGDTAKLYAQRKQDEKLIKILETKSLNTNFNNFSLNYRKRSNIMKNTYTKSEIDIFFREGRAGFTEEGGVQIKTDDGKYIVCTWDPTVKLFNNCKEISPKEAKAINTVSMESINNVYKTLDVLIENVNSLLMEIKQIKNVRDLKKWRPPVTREERRKMYEKNPKCFLKVEKTKTGEILPKYPVCPRGSTTPTCEGLIAAIRRANMLHDREVAKKAYRMAKSVCKAEGLSEDSIPDPWYK